MSPKTKVEGMLKDRISNLEFSKAAKYVESIGFLVSERSPEAVLRVVKKHIVENRKGASASPNSNN